ncbi:hypothetical protein IIC68_03630 [archaeon]|nr:hypothetical protein [archaeon]
MRKLLIYIILIFLLSISVFAQLGFFSPKAPPGQAPGYLCSIGGCVLLGDINGSGFSLFNIILQMQNKLWRNIN